MTMTMASSSLLHCSLSFNFSSRTPPLSASRLSITPSLSTKKMTLNHSSSHSISTSAPLVLSRVPSPPQKPPQPFTVVCVKGYKMKTHTASAKRFWVSRSGKIMRRRAGKQHLLMKKNTKHRLRLSKMVKVMKSNDELSEGQRCANFETEYDKWYASIPKKQSLLDELLVKVEVQLRNNEVSDSERVKLMAGYEKLEASMMRMIKEMQARVDKRDVRIAKLYHNAVERKRPRIMIGYDADDLGGRKKCQIDR
ncbi:PREDICTED: 50S ribosomal protein L35, chloroplastic-like [Ipomoea nil]|uniref:50S ribosomal protein L35, chloroplastic-like n=1 Tax=Ipomoea nil TaxID=35883 RepID=UPI0009012473|nr:PREDICTED: 50S ribosomal protein L35, chloroplastic-like [Ipomoea nil]